MLSMHYGNAFIKLQWGNVFKKLNDILDWHRQLKSETKSKHSYKVVKVYAVGFNK